MVTGWDQQATRKRVSISTPTILAIFGFLSVVAILWGPFGLKTTGIMEEWIRLENAEGNNIRFTTIGSGARPLNDLLRYGFSKLTPGTTVALDFSLIFAFFFKGLMMYGIVSILLPQHPSVAFATGVLFLLYPAEPDPFTMRSATNQQSFALYLIAVYLLLVNYRKPSNLRLRVMVITLVCSLLLYEVAYTTAFLVPLLLIWLDKGISKRVMRVAAVWYAALAICLAYTLNFYFRALSDPQSYTSSNSAIGDSSFLDLLKKTVRSIATAYNQHFKEGWLDTLDYLKPVTAYHYYAIGLALAVGLITLYLINRSTFASRNIRKDVRQYSFLLVLGLLILGLDFLPYSVTNYTWRIYIRSAAGAALSLVVVVFILIQLIPNVSIRKFVFVIFTVISVYMAGAWSLYKHEDLIIRTLAQQDFLSEIARQVPDVADNTAIIIVTDLNNNIPLPTYKHLSAALRLLYDNQTLRGEVCIPATSLPDNNLARVRYSLCEFGEDRLIGQVGKTANPLGHSFNYPYKHVLFFQLHRPDDLELLATVPSEYLSSAAPTTYHPEKLINEQAQAPARAQTMFLDWPVEKPLCDDTPVPLAGCNLYKAQQDLIRVEDASKNQNDPELLLESLSRVIENGLEDAMIYLRRGNIYYQQGELDKALADYNQAIELDSHHAVLYLRRGDVYLQQGALDKALADYDRAIELDPNNAVLYLRRGKVYGRQQAPDLTITEYSHAIELDSTNAEAYLQRGNVYYDLEQFELALADYQHYVEFAHDEADVEIVALINELENTFEIPETHD